MWCKTVLFLCLICFYIDSSLAQDSNCDLPNNADEWANALIIFDAKDNDLAAKLIIQTVNVVDVTVQENKYIICDFDPVKQELIFKLKEDFKNYIQNEDNELQDRIELNFICTTGKINKNIRLKVIEVTNYAPEFLEPSYEFELTMPIYKNTDLPLTEVSAKDINIANQNLQFSFTDGICGELFQFIESKKSGKTYTTHLKTIQAVELVKSATCGVKVQDKGNMASSSSLTIKVDIKTSVPSSPIFKEPLYLASYDEHMSINLFLENSDYEPIPTLLQVAGTADYSTYFDVKVETDGIITVFATSPIPEENLENINYIPLVVQVEYVGAKYTGKTVLLINTPKSSEPPTTTACPTVSTETATTCEPCSTVEPPTTTECPTVSTETATTCEPCSTIEPPTTTECPTVSTETTATCEPCDCTTSPGTAPTSPTTSTCEPCSTNEPTVITECPSVSTETCTCEPCGSSTTQTSESTDPGQTPQSTYSTSTSISTDSSTTCPECPSSPGPTNPSETTCPTHPTCPTCDTTSSSSGSTASSPSACPTEPATCKPCESEETSIRFKKNFDFYDKDSEFTGRLDTIIAESDIAEKITYEISDVNPSGIRKKINYKADGEIEILEKLQEGTYKISLKAKGVLSNSEDSAYLILRIKSKTSIGDDGKLKFDYSLLVEEVKENDPAKTIVSTTEKDYEYIFHDDNSVDVTDWFEISKGKLIVKTLDRENPKISSMLVPQVKAKIQLVKKPAKLQNTFFSSPISNYEYHDWQTQLSCINITNIPMKLDEMVAVVKVIDVNDNKPVFVDKSPLIIGYPDEILVEFIAPPYLVKVTATDEDIGINAKIKYSTNNDNFIADSDNGIIYLRKQIDDNTEFKVIAEDHDGKDGFKVELTIHVKILKEKDILVITVEDIKYSEVDQFVGIISEKTKQNVKYLSSTVVPKAKNGKEKRSLKLLKDDDELLAVKIILYALDKHDEVISATEFKKMIDGVDIGEKIQVEEYVKPNGTGDEDNTGWIAAVSTLSVLLALVIIGALVGYIFFVRPRLMESTPTGYIKHTSRDSLHLTPVENKKEPSSLAGRRATGFPLNFTPEEFDDDYEEVEEVEKVQDKEQDKAKDNESTNDSEDSSSPNLVRRKSIVKFDNNVTEIEIEIEKF